MPRQMKPVAVMKSTRRIHRSNGEIEAREKSEIVQVSPGSIVPPSYLTAAQKKHFLRLAEQLETLKIMGETDCEALARYVTAEGLYEEATKDIRKIEKERPDQDSFDSYDEYANAVDLYYKRLDNAVKRQDRMCDQASALARDLGLTISSRCKLLVPKSEEPKVNKFAVLQVDRDAANS